MLRVLVPNSQEMTVHAAYTIRTTVFVRDMFMEVYLLDISNTGTTPLRALHFEGVAQHPQLHI